MHCRPLATSALFGLTLTACGGGNATLTPTRLPSPGMPAPNPTPSPTATAASSGPTGKATVTLTFPLPAGSAIRKRASYLSAKTLSVTLSVTSVNGVAPTTIIATTVPIGTSAAGCANVSGQLACAISIDAPTGSDVFSIRTYPVANGAGQPLSVGTASATIVAGVASTLSAPLLPVVDGVTVNESPATLPLGIAGNTTLSFTARDAVGDVIAGSEPYYLPIDVTTADTSGHVSTTPALPAKITAPGQTIALHYDGIGTGASFVFNVGGEGDAFVRGAATTSFAFPFSGGGEHIYVSQETKNSISVYDINADGSISGPSRTIAGPSTKLDRPISLTVDSLGTLYVANLFKNVTIYSPGATGDAAPIATVDDGLDVLFVAKDGPTNFGVGFVSNGSDGKPDYSSARIGFLTDYSAPGLPGTLPLPPQPVLTLNIPSIVGFSIRSTIACAASTTGGIPCYTNPIDGTGRSDGSIDPTAIFILGGVPNALEFRSDGLLAVVQGPTFNSPVSISTYDLGTITPMHQLLAATPKFALSGSNTGFAYPTAIAFDKLGNMYIDDYGQASFAGTIKQYPQNASGNIAAARSISGLDQNFGMAIGP